MRWTHVLAITTLVAVVAIAILTSTVSPTIVHAQKTVVVLRTHSWWTPQKRKNPFAPNAIIIPGLVYERLAYWIKEYDIYAPELAVSWKIDRQHNEIIVKLRKGVYWHDGYPFTCKDVWTTLMIYKALGRGVWKYIDSVECKDDYTVVYHVKKWAYLILWYVLYQDGMIVGPYHIYGKWAEEIAKATSKSQMEAIVRDLLKFEPSRIIGTGPYMVKTITSSETILVKFDKYWNAKRVYIDEIDMPYIVSNQVGWQYYLTGRLDYDCFMMPYSVMVKVESKPFAKIVKIWDMSGFMLVFNFRNKWLRIPEVRWAIAMVINRTRVAEAAGRGLFDPVKYPTGLLKMQTPWIEDLIAKGLLKTYSYNPTKAAELLEKVGFKKINGVWYTPDGKPFKLTLIAPGGWTDWDAAMEEVAKELKAFGIQTELRTPDAPAYWSSSWYKGGKGFDIAIDFYGVWMTYPWKAMKRIWLSVDVTPKKIIQGDEFYTWEQHIYLPAFHTYINAINLTNELAVTFDKAEQKKIVEMLAYAVNYWLPVYPIAEKHLVLYINVQHFVWPDPKLNYWLYQNAAGGHLEALAFMIKHGYVVPNPRYWKLTYTVTLPKTITVPVTKTITVPKTVTVTSSAVITKTKTATVTVSAPPVAKVVTVTSPVVITKTTVSPVTVTKYVTVTKGVSSGLLYAILGVAIVTLIGAWVAVGVGLKRRAAGG